MHAFAWLERWLLLFVTGLCVTVLGPMAFYLLFAERVQQGESGWMCGDC